MKFVSMTILAVCLTVFVRMMLPDSVREEWILTSIVGVAFVSERLGTWIAGGSFWEL